MTQSSADDWASEIRDYLLGRLSDAARIESLRHEQQSELRDHPPIRRWWIFEGKQYATLGGPLARNWDAAIRIVRRLDETFNPRRRLSDRADGVVDWGQTFARGPHRLQAEYVVLSSGVGLNDEERTALRGWARWVREEWVEYAQKVAIEPCVESWSSFAAK